MKTEHFSCRHIGISPSDKEVMLSKIKASSIEELIEQTIPSDIRLKEELSLPEELSEHEYAEHIQYLSSRNRSYATYIGLGWYETVVPAAIYRNVFENPCWYTSYTPYQAEISQGRLEALYNFQTVVSELTALPLANCSLLDEATAGAEAITMMHGIRSRSQVKSGANKVFVDQNIYPQTLAVIKTRMKSQDIEVIIGDYKTIDLDAAYFGAVLQYPNSNGNIENYAAFTEKAHQLECKIAVASDLMALLLLTPPGEWGADIAFGSSQRFGVPMFYGGPSAAFFSTRDEFKRFIPGRIIGMSKDSYGKRALRMALQTREQHIKREKATSNICTAQALLATMSSFYAVYHGEEGLKKIAHRIHSAASIISEELGEWGYKQLNEYYFDTLKIALPDNISQSSIKSLAEMREINFRYFKSGEIGISIGETITDYRIHEILAVFALAAKIKNIKMVDDLDEVTTIEKPFLRTSRYLQFDVFNSYHTETELMRYIKRLERRDISLTHSMISLGSCTMKLNAASELLPLGLSGLQNIHPFAPADQVEGYSEMISDLANYLCEITGFAGVSFQPNSGAAGEYAGLITICAYHNSKGEGYRNIVLIPASAHGTNPASAAQAGLSVVVVDCDEFGNIKLDDLKKKAEEHRANLAAFMVTYPSTNGIFETEIREMIEIIHENGGQVYMDGANMNAQVGLTNPGNIGADVCHLNLHKTFSIPHGGGGPGQGPICMAEHLVPFMPHHEFLDESDLNAVASAPFGSAGILTITYGYIRMMGAKGLKEATEAAILNANYLADSLQGLYDVLFRGKNGRVAHELIIECRNIKTESGISETDIAKRLIDYGYHAPTLSFPIHGTLMIEPTESESLAELDKFIAALTEIRHEIREVQSGKYSQEDNVLVNAPHPEYEVVADDWKHSYSRSKAVYPLEYVAENKFWVNVARVDNAFGDRNLVASLGNCCS